ncbi:ribonuclease T2 [Stipitochalara longipes BDJ]|nr:ribonuclease T2 [Stipitochalara longipes BDJ]
MPVEIPSIRSLSALASGLISQLPFGGFNTPSKAYVPYGNAPSCPSDSPLSCHNSTAAPDSCCFIYPGGQLLQTQFWDTSPAIGPDDSWTLHGLWPDLCDGSYPQFCTEAPNYSNISDIISASQNPDLLTFMNSYWLPNSGSAESFWEHEWNKHGTCINTLAPSCYGDGYQPGDEVVDFFTKAVETFKGLDTYKALAAAGILPSTSKTYTSDEIQAALTPITGSAVVLGCRGGRLDEAWYSFNVQGSLQTGEFVPTNPAGKGGRGTCPAKGIRYLPKSSSSANKDL